MVEGVEGRRLGASYLLFRSRLLLLVLIDARPRDRPNVGLRHCYRLRSVISIPLQSVEAAG